MTIRPQIQLYERRLEFFSLMWPAILLFFVVLNFIYFSQNLTTDQNFYMLVLSSVFFLEVTHAFLTFVLITQLPEFKNWVKAKTGGKTHFFWIRCLTVFLIFFMTTLAINISSVSQSLKLILLFIFLAYKSQHAIFQTQGLSLTYNSLYISAFNGGRESDDFLKSRFFEKCGFYVLVLMLVGTAFYKIFLENLFRIYAENLLYLAPVSLVLAAFVSLAFFIKSFLLIPKNYLQNKFFFLISRISLYFFSFTSPFALFLYAGVHGVDYLCIYKKIIDGSNLSKKENGRVVLLTGLVMLTFGSLYLVYLYFDSILLSLAPESSLAVRVIASLFMAYGGLHYYLDAYIFKMRDPINRHYIGPLMLIGGQSEHLGEDVNLGKLYPT